MNIFFQSTIFFSLALYCVETLPELVDYHYIFVILNWIVVAIFTVEYLGRIIFEKDRKKYMLSFFGIIDLAAILPSLLTLGTTDLSFVRVIRILRIFRIFKLMRYSKASDRLLKALRSVKEEIAVFIFAAFVLLFFAAAGIYYFEHQAQPEQFRSIFSAFWWAIVTLTTVGYGDIYPVTVGGRIFTGGLLIIGLGIVAVPSGIFASALSNDHKEE